MKLDKGCDDKKKKRNMLKNVRVNEISSVGQGANEGAFVSLFKSAEPDSELKTEERKKMELEKKIEELEANNKSLVDKLTKITWEASLNDLQKAYYSGLEGGEKESFEKMAVEDRERAVSEAIKKAEAADETLDINGKEIKKSAIGAEAFELLKVAEDEKAQLRKERELEKAKVIQKQDEEDAEKEFPHLAGTPENKAKLLKIARGDKDLMAVIKGADAALEGRMAEIGTSAVDESGELGYIAKLEKMAQVKAAEDGITHADAYSAIMRTPEGAELYDKVNKS